MELLYDLVKPQRLVLQQCQQQDQINRKTKGRYSLPVQMRAAHEISVKPVKIETRPKLGELKAACKFCRYIGYL